MSVRLDDPGADLKFVVTTTIIVQDIQRSMSVYRDVLDATVLRQGEPTFLRLGKHLARDQCWRRADRR